MCADDERDKYSQREGFVTKRIANNWVEKDVDRLALSIAGLANKRYREIIMKLVLDKLSQTLENFE